MEPRPSIGLRRVLTSFSPLDDAADWGGGMHYGMITGGCLRRISALLAVASCAAHAALLSPVAGLAAEPQPTLQALQQQLDRRDALIQALTRRLDVLARHVGQS